MQLLFQLLENQLYVNTTAHLPCLKRRRMCSTFFNNLIYRRFYSPVHHEVNSLETGFNILLINCPKSGVFHYATALWLSYTSCNCNNIREVENMVISCDKSLRIDILSGLKISVQFSFLTGMKAQFHASIPWLTTLSQGSMCQRVMTVQANRWLNVGWLHHFCFQDPATITATTVRHLRNLPSTTALNHADRPRRLPALYSDPLSERRCGTDALLICAPGSALAARPFLLTI